MLYALVILVLCAGLARSEETLQTRDDLDTGTHLFEQRSSGSECMDLIETSGNITEVYTGPRNMRYNRCWKILNPDNQQLRINISPINFYSRSCYYVYMTITEKETGREYKYCHDTKDRRPLTVYSDVTVRFYVDSNELYVDGKTNIHLLYDIDTSIEGVRGVHEARQRGISWMKHNASSWNWIENISKVVTSLVLSDGAGFDGKNMQEELLLKQRELRISVSLLRDSVSNEQLSMFINSLVASCHNPRSFYGHDLVKKLKTQVESSENFTHPSVYLALCNANEPWPEKATKDLIDVFESQSKYPFLRDIQSFASMAVSCKINRSKNFNSTGNVELVSAYELNLQQFKNEQREAGNFGNVHRTALMTQALIAAEHEYEEDWRSHKAVKYLINALNSSTNNFLITYLTLPILSVKSLAHIASINCSAHPRNHDDLVAEIHDYLGPKIRVQYSLFVGEEKDVIHTISLRVPKNFSAYNVMRLAEIKDPKYRFLFEIVSGRMDIYDISGIPNDPEDAKFWLLYLGSMDNNKIFNHLTSNPDKLKLNDGDHLVMWYKTAQV